MLGHKMCLRETVCMITCLWKLYTCWALVGTCRQVRNLECSQRQHKCTHRCTFNADAEPLCNFLHLLYLLTSCKILQVWKEHSRLWLCRFLLQFPTPIYYARYYCSAALLLKIRSAGMSCCVSELVFPNVLTGRLAAITQLHSITF